MARRASFPCRVGACVIASGVVDACGVTGDSSPKTGHTSAALVVCSCASTVQGVDVSEYQGSIDWAQVAASGLGFAIARVSDGTAYPDPTFAANWSGIKAAGMDRGVYQFFRASADPTAQANMVVSAVGSIGPGDLPPVADVEVMDGESGDTLVANLATWVSVIRSNLGVTPIIYSAPGFWDALPGTRLFASEPLWVANWLVSCPDTPTPWTGWTFWQYADDGNVPGISGAVDLDEYDGTREQLDQVGGATPVPPSAPLDAGVSPREDAGDDDDAAGPSPLEGGGTEPHDASTTGGEETAEAGQGWAQLSSHGRACALADAAGASDASVSVAVTMGAVALVASRRRRPPRVTAGRS